MPIKKSAVGRNQKIIVTRNSSNGKNTSGPVETALMTPSISEENTEEHSLEHLHGSSHVYTMRSRKKKSYDLGEHDQRGELKVKGTCKDRLMKHAPSV